jgi:hypothetical protein
MQITEQLDRIEERLLTFRQSEEEFRVDVERNFRCLREEVRRGGRTAFRYALFGAILSIGLAFLTPEETRQVVDFATQQFNNVTQLLTHSE